MFHNIDDPQVRDPDAQETDMGAYMLSEIPEVWMLFVPKHEL
jgi:hypothetical protein